MKNIIRIEKRKKFTVISRDLLEDNRLQWSTRGILGYLLSKPDNWVLQVQDLKKQGDLGRDAIYNRIKNAIQHGYITRIDHRDSKGRITGVEYIVHEEPIKPLPENPESANQEQVRPNPVNTDNTKDEVLINTDTTTTTVCSSRDLKFHSQLTNIEKQEISKLIAELSDEQAQDILFELSGFIDKNLIQKDPISLVQGLVRKLNNGEFSLRLGLNYKESYRRSLKIQQKLAETDNDNSFLPEADVNNSLVKKVLEIKERRSKCQA